VGHERDGISLAPLVRKRGPKVAEKLDDEGEQKFATRRHRALTTDDRGHGRHLHIVDLVQGTSRHAEAQGVHYTGLSQARRRLGMLEEFRDAGVACRKEHASVSDRPLA
jgi:hypothetical protein